MVIFTLGGFGIDTELARFWPRRACFRQQIAELTFHLPSSSAQAAQAGAITSDDRGVGYTHDFPCTPLPDEAALIRLHVRELERGHLHATAYLTCLASNCLHTHLYIEGNVILQSCWQTCSSNQSKRFQTLLASPTTLSTCQTPILLANASQPAAHTMVLAISRRCHSQWRASTVGNIFRYSSFGLNLLHCQCMLYFSLSGLAHH